MVIGHTLIGNGPQKVIVLHGWLADYTAFDPMLPWLDTGTFTYAFMDYRGYGKSRDMAGSHSIEEIGNDALGLADHLGWDRFHVIGHSMGGSAAQWVIAQAPQRVASGVIINAVPASGVPLEGDVLTLFSTAADVPANRGRIIMMTTGDRHSAAWERYMIEKSMATTTRDAFADYFWSWSQTNFAEKVAGNPTPLLVLPGEHDPALNEAVMQATVMTWFPNARLEVLRNAGHYPMLEVPVHLATVMEAFMREHA
ncbi:MAG TPA: alpha/beta hydrolase [Chloroflexia bacterium]|nr:alpha/beta hydrolase [Chloroflexia bacterium]